MVPYAALHYMTYEQYRCWILNNFAPSVVTGPVVDLLAGSAAGGTAVLCAYPLDLARTKLTYQVSNVAQPGNALGNSGRHLHLHGGVAAQEPEAGRGAPRRPHPPRGVRQDPARVMVARVGLLQAQP